MDKEEYLPVLILERTLCFFSQFTIILAICLCGHDYTRVFLSISSLSEALVSGCKTCQSLSCAF